MSLKHFRLYTSIFCAFLSLSLQGQSVVLVETHTDAVVGLDRKNWGIPSGNTTSHSEGYHHDFTIPPAPNPCSKITSITANVTLNSFSVNHPAGCSHTVLYYNMYYGCGMYSGGASCNTSNLIAEPNFPPNTSLPTQTFSCPALMAAPGGNFSIDVVPVYLTGCNPLWQSAITSGFVTYTYTITVTVNFSNVTCATTGCLAGTRTTIPCNDNNPCTINDMATVLACNNSIVCIPCAGTPNPNGLTVTATPTNPPCGLNNGSILVTPGPGGHSYSWTGGLTGSNPMNVSPGTYTVTVTQTSNGCAGTASVTINGTPPLSVVAAPTPTTCGLDNGSILVTPGPVGHTYSWTGGLSGHNPTNVADGTYTVIVTETSTGCTGTASVTINDSPPLTVGATPIQTSCGLNNGSILVTPGPAGHTYSWTGGLSGHNPTNVAPGTYTVTVTQTSTGCLGTASVTINGSLPLFVSAVPTQPTCGLNTGSVLVTPGPTGHSYIWTGGLSGHNPTNIAPGTYTVTVTELSSGCTNSATVTIDAIPPLSVTAIPTQTTCDQDNGSISVSPGPSGHTYIWTGGLFGQNPTNVAPGTYTVTVTQTSNGCTGSATVVINGSSPLSVAAVPTQTTCGLNNGSILVSPGPAGHSYVWTGGLTGQNPTNLAPGTYSVTVTQSSTGCTGTASVSINSSNPLSVTATPTQPSCGFNNGSIVVIPGPAGHTYTWTGGLSGNNPMNLGAGTYTVTVTQTSIGCTGTATVILNSSANLSVVADATQPSCGQNNGSILVTPGPAGHSYTWTGGLSGNNPMNVGAGTYTVTVTQSSNGCTGTATVILNSSANLTVVADATQPSCGLNNGSILVTPGPAGHTYTWTGGLSGNNPMNVGAGTYTVTVTQTNNGCTGTASVILNSSSGLTVVAAATQPSCGQNNGSISISPGPAGHNYVWTGGLTGQNPSNLGAGTYTVTVTQISNGCTGTASVIINTSSNLTVVAAATQPSCGLNNGSILVTPGPTGHTYSWTGSLSGNNPMNLGSGTYAVTVTQTSDGCTGTASVTLNVSSDLTVVAAATQPSCGQNNGSILVTPGPAGHTYSWTGGLSGHNPTGLGPGIYSVTVTQTNGGCTGTASVTLSASGSLTVTATPTQPSCGQNNGSILVTPGPAGHTYIWTGGLSGHNPMNVGAGSYTVTVTQMNGGCTGTASVILNTSSGLSVVAAPTQPTCGKNNGSILVTPGPAGHTYAWTGSLTGQNPTNVAPGSYTVTVTQTSNGCTGMTSVTLVSSQNIAINCNATPVTGSTTNDGRITITMSNGTSPYTIAWNGGSVQNIAINNYSIMNLAAGNYSVTVTDSKGCTASCQSTVNSVDCKLQVDLISEAVKCFGASDGKINLTIKDANGNPTIIWSNIAWNGQAAVTNASANAYTVTVTDNLGCQVIKNATITQPLAIVLSCNGVGVSAKGLSDGIGNINISGGTPFYSVNWSGQSTGEIIGNLSGIISIPNLSAGDYTLTVTDANNCSSLCSFKVEDKPCALTVKAEIKNPTCFKKCDGEIELIFTGAVNQISKVVWSNPAFADRTMVEDLCDGSYGVVVTDGGGCTAEIVSIVLDQPDSLQVNIVSSNSTPQSNQEFTLSLTTNISPINIASILWTNSALLNCDNCPNPIGKITESSTFSATVTDNNGCLGVGFIDISLWVQNIIHFPNIMSTSSDVNNSFYPRGIVNNITSINYLSVYDRWGNLIYNKKNPEVNNPSDGWDGSFSGSTVGQGIYIFVSEVTFKDGETKVFKGDITVIE